MFIVVSILFLLFLWVLFLAFHSMLLCIFCYCLRVYILSILFLARGPQCSLLSLFLLLFRLLLLWPLLLLLCWSFVYGSMGCILFFLGRFVSIFSGSNVCLVCFGCGLYASVFSCYSVHVRIYYFNMLICVCVCVWGGGGLLFRLVMLVFLSYILVRIIFSWYRSS